MTKLHPDFAAFIINYAKKKEEERKEKALGPALFVNLRNGGNLHKRPACDLWFVLLATVFWLALMAIPAILAILAGMGVMTWLLS